MTRKYLLLTALALVLLAAAGCIFSPDNEDDPVAPPPPRYEFPDTPDKLMANFKAVYENMDFDAFKDMLHPDYKTILQTSTSTLYPEVGTELDLSEELTIHNNMFTGQPGTSPDGTLVAGIVGIQFQILEKQQEWTLTPANDPIPNALQTLYDVIFLFDRGEGETFLRVEGDIKFYVSRRDSVINQTTTRDYYEMRAQEDLTIDG